MMGKSENSKPETFLQIPLVISAGLGLSYILVAQFKRAYLEHFGVTADLVDVSARDVLTSAPFLWIAFGFIMKVTIGTKTKWVRSLYWNLVLAVMFMIILLDAKISSIAWWAILFVSLMLLAWNAYWERKEDLEGKGQINSWHVFEFAESLFGTKAAVMIGLVISTYALGYAFAIGTGKMSARRQTNFLTWQIPGSPDKCAIVGDFQGALICAQYDQRWKTMLRKYRLIPLAQVGTLKREEIGNLQYWW